MGSPDRLSPEDRAEVKRIIAELPPLTDEQLDALADTVAQILMRGGR